MLSKLMYHEFKATRRVFFPAYGIMLALAVISSVFMILSSNLQRLAVPLALLLLAYFCLCLPSAFCRSST